MYKALESNDVTLRKFKVYKTWSCDNTTTGSLGINIQAGEYTSSKFRTLAAAQNPDGSYKHLIWNSVNHLYYHTGSTFDFNYLASFVGFESIMNVSRSISTGIKVLNIPSSVFGERVKPGSVIIETGSVSIFDDKNYNLYISGTSPRTVIGNVFYEHGQIIITSESYTSSFDIFDLSFKSTVEIKEMEVVCNVLEGEFNYSTNLTAAPSESYTYDGYFNSGSNNKPFITTIGLYNSYNELLMVAKLGRPYKRDNDLDTAFVVRADL